MGGVGQQEIITKQESKQTHLNSKQPSTHHGTLIVTILSKNVLQEFIRF